MKLVFILLLIGMHEDAQNIIKKCLSNGCIQVCVKKKYISGKILEFDKKAKVVRCGCISRNPFHDKEFNYTFKELKCESK